MRLIRNQRPGLTWVTAILLAVLLPVLAAMQHRWLDRLSEWEQDRMRGLLEAGADNVCGDIDAPLEVIYRTFQLSFSPGEREETAERFAVAYDRVAQKVGGAASGLYTGIFWVTVSPPAKQAQSAEASAGPDVRIARFLPEDSHLAEITWPAQLAGLRDHLSSFASVPAFPSDEIPVWCEDGILAVTVPHPIPSGGDRGPSVGWVVVIPDREFLTSVFFPALIGKYLGGDGRVELDVAVMSEGAGREILYLSNPGLTAADFSEFDASGDIFRLRAGILMVAAQPSATARPAGSQRVQSGDMHQTEGLSPQAGRGPSVGGTYAGARWRLLVKHPAGSLEAAFSSVRRRNALLSSGILLVLGAAVAVLVVSTRRAQNLARMQMEFVRGISHELRTPLAVISSAGENLADAVIREPEKMREYGKLIQREGRRLTHMVERAIQFSRLQSGHGRYNLQPVDVGELIDRSLEAYRPQLDERGAEVTVEVSELMPRVWADQEALTSAVRNLISNAIKYSRERPKICIGAHEIRAGEGREIRITVRDQGVGIPAADQEKIFEPFYRTWGSREGQIQGSGLGLSLVKEIVEAHGGRVSLTSEPGAGSQFVIHLPLRESAGGSGLHHEAANTPH